MLEIRARSCKSQPQQQSRVKELKAKVAALVMQRDQLKAEIQTHQVRRWDTVQVHFQVLYQFLMTTTI